METRWLVSWPEGRSPRKIPTGRGVARVSEPGEVAGGRVCQGRDGERPLGSADVEDAGSVAASGLRKACSYSLRGTSPADRHPDVSSVHRAGLWASESLVAGTRCGFAGSECGRKWCALCTSSGGVVPPPAGPEPGGSWAPPTPPMHREAPQAGRRETRRDVPLFTNEGEREGRFPPVTADGPFLGPETHPQPHWACPSGAPLPGCCLPGPTPRAPPPGPLTGQGRLGLLKADLRGLLSDAQAHAKCCPIKWVPPATADRKSVV